MRATPCGGWPAQITRPCRTVWSGVVAGECSLAIISASTRGAREVRTGYQRGGVSYARRTEIVPAVQTFAGRTAPSPGTTIEPDAVICGNRLAPRTRAPRRRAGRPRRTRAPARRRRAASSTRPSLHRLRRPPRRSRLLLGCPAPRRSDNAYPGKQLGSPHRAMSATRSAFSSRTVALVRCSTGTGGHGACRAREGAFLLAALGRESAPWGRNPFRGEAARASAWVRSPAAGGRTGGRTQDRRRAGRSDLGRADLLDHAFHLH